MVYIYICYRNQFRVTVCGLFMHGWVWMVTFLTTVTFYTRWTQVRFIISPAGHPCCDWFKPAFRSQSWCCMCMKLIYMHHEYMHHEYASGIVTLHELHMNLHEWGLNMHDMPHQYAWCTISSLIMVSPSTCLHRAWETSFKLPFSTLTQTLSSNIRTNQMK